MDVIEEDPLRIQSESRRKRNRRDKEKAHGREEEEAKKKIIKKSEILMSLTDLPSNVLVEILARLPIRTLYVARSVCKTFVFLTTDNPHFINLHSLKATQILVFQSSSLLRMADDHKLDYKISQLKAPLFQLPKQYKGAYYLINSCNGLLFFKQAGLAGDYGCLVCNPVTSEYIKIPDAVTLSHRIRFDAGLWLGFSHGSNQYKLLRIISRSLDEFAAQVYVIGSDNSWRDIGDSPDNGLGKAQFVNGLMYWWHYMGTVFSFDFEREKFEDVGLPPEFQYERVITKHKHVTSIGVLGGCLCLSCNDVDVHCLDLWVMRKCGNQESWTKDFVVDTLTLGPRGGPVFGMFEPLQFLGNGKILMIWKWTKAFIFDTIIPVCYDSRTKSLRRLRLHMDRWGYRVVTLTPSIVPLKDALKVDKVLTQSRPRVMKSSCEKRETS